MRIKIANATLTMLIWSIIEDTAAIVLSFLWGLDDIRYTLIWVFTDVLAVVIGIVIDNVRKETRGAIP
jgi:hypothetical protein